MINKKTWSEFHETGLLLFVNHFLHIFGWIIVIEKKDNKIVDVYPAKTTFRGFSKKSYTKAYKQLTNYMRDNIPSLLDAFEEEEEDPIKFG